jgi:hypothetical protein
MRSYYKAGKLHPLRTELLNSIGFNWLSKDADLVRDKQLHKKFKLKTGSQVHAGEGATLHEDRPGKRVAAASERSGRGGGERCENAEAERDAAGGAGAQSKSRAREPSGSDREAVSAAPEGGSTRDLRAMYKELQALLGSSERSRTSKPREEGMSGQGGGGDGAGGAGDRGSMLDKGKQAPSEKEPLKELAIARGVKKEKQLGRAGRFGSRGAKGRKGRFVRGGSEEEGLVPDKLLTLRRHGNPNQIAPFVRICFMWAPREWYFGTVTSETTSKGWWNVEWDDKTKNQLLFSMSNRMVWFILKDEADERHVAMLQQLQEKEQQALDRQRSAEAGAAPPSTHADDGARGGGGGEGVKRKAPNSHVDMSKWAKGWKTRKKLAAAATGQPAGQQSEAGYQKSSGSGVLGARAGAGGPEPGPSRNARDETKGKRAVVQGSPHADGNRKKSGRLAMGTLAVIQGISSKPHYNGLHVVVQAQLKDDDKYNVKLLHPNETIDVKPNVIVKGLNLRVLDSRDMTQASRDSRAAVRAAVVGKRVEEEEEEREWEEQQNEFGVQAKEDEKDDSGECLGTGGAARAVVAAKAKKGAPTTGTGRAHAGGGGGSGGGGTAKTGAESTGTERGHAGGAGGRRRRGGVQDVRAKSVSAQSEDGSASTQEAAGGEVVDEEVVSERRSWGDRFVQLLAFVRRHGASAVDLDHVLGSNSEKSVTLT